MKKLGSILALILALSLLMLSACTTPADDGADKLDVLSVCVGPNPDTIDPALNSSVDGATMIIHAFEGLYTLDKDGVPVPGQAASVDISEDGTVYTFHLKDGLKWSEGTKLTAEDFVYSWNRAIAPETAADYEYMFDVIKGYDDGALDVVAVDEQTLQVTLNVATPYFLELTAFPTFSPVLRPIVEANGEAWATKADTYIGNGPYRMTEWVASSYIMYEKNPNYWDVANLGTEKIKFVLMEDDNAQLAAYTSGELQFIDTVPNDEIDTLKARPDFYIEGQLGTYYISFNVNDPALANPKFRQALTLAINRPFICAEIGKAGQQPAAAFVSTGLSDAAPGSSFRVPANNYFDPGDHAGNVAKAKAIIKEEYTDKGIAIPTFEYLYNTDTGHQAIAEALQNDWKEIGVNITIQSQEWGTFLQTRKNHEFQIARNGWLNDYNDPIGMLDMFVTGGGNNDGDWKNAQFDQLIQEIKGSSDPAVRFAKMHEAEDLLMGDWALSPIYYYVDIYMMNEKLEGAWSSPLGYKYFMYATAAK